MAENITYLQVLRRGWWIILLTILAAVTAALVATSRMPAQYQSLSRYVVGPNADLVQDTDLLRSLDTLERGTIIATYAEIFESESVTSAALQENQLTKQAAESYLITSYGLPETNILVISVRGTNPNMVMKLNQAVANQGLAYIETLNQVYSLNLLDAPQQPDAPVGPDQLRNVGIALVLGIGLGGLLALLRTSIVPATRPVLTQDEAAAEVPVSTSQKNRVSSI
jgi:capsular polysaccharide biosynthesis protein